jgi:hypothetical protein
MRDQFRSSYATSEISFALWESPEKSMTLKWNSGVHNFMTYATADIPVGAYDPNRIANLGLGHGAIDGGGGYTYLNPATGHTFSGVARG